MANDEENTRRYTCVNCGRKGAKGYKKDPNNTTKKTKYVCTSEVKCNRYKAERDEAKKNKPTLQDKRRAKREENKQKPYYTKKPGNAQGTNNKRKSRPQEQDEELIEAIKAGEEPNKTDGEVATRNGEPYRKYDWDRVRTLFIEGVPKDVAEPDGDRDWLNLKELSQRLNIPYPTLATRSSKERWPDKKLAYQTMITRERQQQRSKKLAGAATEFDDKALTVAQLGVQLVHARLGEIVVDVKDRQQLRQQALAARQQGLPIDPAHLRTAIHSTELERLGKSAQLFQEIGMKALGTDIERHQIDGSINVDQTVSVNEELERDDAKRLAGFVAAAQRTNIFAEVMQELEEQATGEENTADGSEDEVFDAEIVEDSVGESPTKTDSDQPTENTEQSTQNVAELFGEQPTESVEQTPKKKKTVNIRTNNNNNGTNRR